jgi:hypothetical protein
MAKYTFNFEAVRLLRKKATPSNGEFGFAEIFGTSAYNLFYSREISTFF